MAEQPDTTRDELRAEIAAFRAEFCAGVAEMRAEIAEFRAEFRAGVATLRGEMVQQITSQTKWLTGIVLAAAAFTVALVKLIP